MVIFFVEQTEDDILLPILCNRGCGCSHRKDKYTVRLNGGSAWSLCSFVGFIKLFVCCTMIHEFMPKVLVAVRSQYSYLVGALNMFEPCPKLLAKWKVVFGRRGWRL